MGGVEETISTPPMGYANGQHELRRQYAQSGEYIANGNGSYPTTPDAEQNARFQQPYQQQPMQPYSRPSSGLPAPGHGYSQTYQEQNQRPAPSGSEATRNQSSVVIKVGMVGDAQIGKTSLMVKYVEGSWDEDYIQTLGIFT